MSSINRQPRPVPVSTKNTNGSGPKLMIAVRGDLSCETNTTATSSRGSIKSSVSSLSLSSSPLQGRVIRKRLNANNKCGNHIRSRYLHKLGIDQRPINSKQTSNCHTSASDTKPKRGPSYSYRESLNESFHRNFNKVSNTTSTTIRKRKITFSNNVCVRVIPSIDMYTERVKRCLWNTPEYLAKNAQRNQTEFIYENYDYRQAVEEQSFFTCPSTGEVLHPAHVHWVEQFIASHRRLQASSSSSNSCHHPISKTKQLPWQQQQHQTLRNTFY
jgi:hypothetical protein